MKKKNKKHKKLHQVIHNIAEAHRHSKILEFRCRPCPSICTNQALTKIPPRKVLPISTVACLLYLGWLLSEAPNVPAQYFLAGPFISPLDCFSLIFIDIFHGLKPDPF
jgi:hypothetical protein